MNQPRPAATEGRPSAPLVRVEGITKSFGGARALRGVSLEVLPGEVHALLGENGAGKSTLIKILSGVHSADGGTIDIAGRRAEFDSPSQSREAGIAVVYQDLSLVES
ncbi:ATP-binding cassette domain-containing protein, partial [Klebsiella pneumoniae]|uniref:ATP-binding cassette domain-containing protein n=1 Tax=Klebsiella pneumoniae TaxID=573 RepID=UPI0037244D68